MKPSLGRLGELLSSLLLRFVAIENRWPWLLPTISFAAGWVGFLLVRRGENLARGVALLALCGWFWLLMLFPWDLLSRIGHRGSPKLGGVKSGHLACQPVTES